MIVYFKIWSWMKFIFYCISWYAIKWSSFSIIFQNMHWNESLNNSVFQNMILNEHLIISYGEISYKMSLGWYCIQKYDMNWYFILYHIYRYSRKWSEFLGFFKEKSGVSGRIGSSFFWKASATGGSGTHRGENVPAAGGDSASGRAKGLSAQCDAVCAVLKKVYICRRIREIDDAWFASSAGRAHPF